MSIEKALQKFADRWVKNMKKKAPYKTGRLRDSIKVIDKPEPVIEMVGYGQFVNDGHRTRGTTKVGPNPSPDGFIQPSFNETFKQFEDDFSKEAFKEIELAFDKTFK